MEEEYLCVEVYKKLPNDDGSHEKELLYFQQSESLDLPAIIAAANFELEKKFPKGN